MDFTINFGAINLLVVFGATVASNLLGGIWYSPLVFGKLWAAANNMELGTGGMGNAPGYIDKCQVFEFACSLAQALAHLVGNGEQYVWILAANLMKSFVGNLRYFT